MRNLFFVFSGLFLCAAASLLIISLLFLIRSFTNAGRNSKSIDVINSQNCAILSGDAPPEDKAAAVERLISTGYISVQILKNKGNNYDDKQLSSKYSSTLTADYISILFSLEATNGGYSL